jgi:hypothetical protein
MPISFAQLCKNVSSIEKSESHQIHLYGTGSTETDRTISSVDFINCFYSAPQHNTNSENGESDIKFSMGEDKASRDLVASKVNLQLWYEANETVLFEVAQRVPSEYAEQMCCQVNDFDTCSLMNIRSELLELEDLGNACKSQQLVCCSLTLEELAETIYDAGTGSGDGSVASMGFTTVEDDGGRIKRVTTSDPEAAKLLPDGTTLTMSVMITNPSNKVSDVELILHYKIVN